ncbi:MAG: DMT family transporter [Nisaea sp.]|uniref:DMT family transporter n=1 Tax=Nisaea sp. TaxID=2024842 RepID=UPI001B00ACBE|nr:DMT family transporter [Nisaea sp.]MBO6561831.1 DMT family transporter [Nisaea sp.]
MTDTTASPIDRPSLGIALILIGMLAISINDMLIKQLSGGYPLHQMVFTRSAIGIAFSLVIVQFEGGWQILKTNRPGLHALRGLLVVIANMSYFAALAVLPLADATALFFAAPLFITLLSIPVLREKVGPFRLGAVLVGFIGVVIMQRPWASPEDLGVSRLVLVLPVISAITYAGMQIMTRKLGMSSKPSALAVYIQTMFLLVAGLFWIFAGDGRFSEGTDNESLIFLLRAWVWPEGVDFWLFVGLGFNSAAVAYCLSAAYRAADAAIIAPFEYTGLLLAVFWGWAIWGEIPGLEVKTGIVLIMGAGLFVFLRERQRNRPLASDPPRGTGATRR